MTLQQDNLVKTKKEIKRVKSNSGKRTMYVPLINGKRLSSTRFVRKWEAKNLIEYFVRKYGEAKLNEMTL